MAASVAAHSTPAASSSAPETAERRAAFISMSVAVAFLAAGSVVTMTSWHGVHVSIVVTLAVASIVGSRVPISLMGGNVIVSGEFVPLVAAVLLEPRLAPALAMSAFLTPASIGVRLLGTSQSLIATCAAVLVTGSVVDGGSPASLALGTLLATFVVGGLSAFQVLVYEVVVWRSSFRELAPMLAGSLIATTAVVVPITYAAVLAVDLIGAPALPLVLVPLAVVQYFLSLYHRKVQLTEELAEKAQVLARTNLQFAAAMVKALDARDAYTAGHSAAVAVYTRDIAREMGFDDETVRMAHLAGLLHDIGKIGVPGRVLNKTSPLDDEEYELMKSHAAMGAEILGEVDLYADIAVLIRYHHERIDGRGYPHGIGGEAIPAISRMISVADTYSAMTTDRPYRDGMPTEKAMSILRECRGTQLDSDYTDAFLRILVVADEDYQRGKQTDFEVEVAKHQALSGVEAEAVRIGEPSPIGPKAPAAPEVPMLPAAVDGELIEVELEREAA